MPYACAGLLGFLLFCYAIVGVLFHHCVTFSSEAGVYFANSFPQSQSSSYMQNLPLSILLDSHYSTISIIISTVLHFPNSGTLPQLYPSPSISCHPAAGLTDYRAAQDIPRSCRRIQPLQVSFPQGVCLSLSRQYP